MTPQPDVQSWIGRTEMVADTLDLRTAHLMHSILPQARALKLGDPMPPLWHWLFFHAAVPLDQLGRDGHAKTGGFLPDVGLPRRMWAGGRVTFLADLHLGEIVEKTSTILKITPKRGSGGPLCFITVQHCYYVDGDLKIREEQDLVYREDPSPITAPPAPTMAPTMAPEDADITEPVYPSPVMLFRYSAITFNSHRIHYDRDYSRYVEGYPGLVFHGPLTATLLANMGVQQSGRPLSSFSYRGISPLFDNEPFDLCARLGPLALDIWAAKPDGGLAMTAQATYK